MPDKKHLPKTLGQVRWVKRLLKMGLPIHKIVFETGISENVVQRIKCGEYVAREDRKKRKGYSVTGLLPPEDKEMLVWRMRRVSG